jgi:hypothetical protein
MNNIVAVEKKALLVWVISAEILALIASKAATSEMSCQAALTAWA